MSLTLPVSAGAQVLLTRPGGRVAETVHRLTEQGATVTVRVEPSTPTSVRVVLDDLAGRRLLTVSADADPGAFDVVLRTPAPEPRPSQAPSGQAPAQRAAPARTGRVTLVGGGPGDPGLLTVAGLAAIRAADVLVCDRLAPLSMLAEARPGAEVVHVGKIPRGAFTPQETINELLVQRALAGHHVVRLKGGDNFVFARGGEEWNACVERGIPVTVVPGVTSAVAVPALGGIPVTHRALTPGFVVVSGHAGPGDPRSETDWARLATCGLTLVVLMGSATLEQITTELLAHGMDPATPAACIADGSLPSQRKVVATLLDIAWVATEQGFTPPVVTVIGPVVTALQDQP